MHFTFQSIYQATLYVHFFQFFFWSHDLPLIFSDFFFLASFYTAAPLSLCCDIAPELCKFALNTAAEFIVKGKTRMPALELDWWEFTTPLAKLGWLPWAGAAIFSWGWLHQRRCHAILVCFSFLLRISYIYTLLCDIKFYLLSGLAERE